MVLVHTTNCREKINCKRGKMPDFCNGGDVRSGDTDTGHTTQTQGLDKQKRSARGYAGKKVFEMVQQTGVWFR